MRKALVAANWKVNGNLGDIAAYSASLQCPDPEFVEVAIFPPAVYLSEMARALGQQPAAVGIQDVGIASKGAHTGEIAAQMVAELGGSWAIVGHSERRLDQHETDDLVATKALAALQGGLNAMICVGETLAERQAGHEIAVVERQLEAVLDRLEPNQLAQCGIGYEPVWAIGTGETASPDEAQAMHSFIRAKIGDWDAQTGS